MLDWNDLKLVLAIAEAGTLSGATRLLTVSQPTVSRRLTAFETMLGLKLFDRGPAGYRLTSAGERVHACAQQMELEVRAIERNIVDDAAPEGHIVLTSPEAFGICCLTPLLAEFHARFPGISIDMIVSAEAVKALRRSADVAIRLGNPNSDRLERRPIGNVHFSIFGSTDYFEKNSEPKKMNDLGQHTTIGSSGEMSDLIQPKFLVDVNGGATINFTTDNLMNRLAAVKAGLGLATLPTYMAANVPEIRQVLADEFNPTRDLWILTPKELAGVERIRTLVEFLAKRIGEKLIGCDHRLQRDHPG